MERVQEICHRSKQGFIGHLRRNHERKDREINTILYDHRYNNLNNSRIKYRTLMQITLISSFLSWLLFSILGNLTIILTSIILIVAIWQFRYIRSQDKKREKLKAERLEQIKEPFETQFYIPKLVEHKVDYREQDDDIHLEDELTLSPNSEHDLMIRSRARLKAILNEIQFGCSDYERGIDYLKSMPEPLYYFNPWIKKGMGRKVKPDSDKDHYIDTPNIYHIKRHGETIPKGHDLLSGFRIKTKKKGVYNLSYLRYA